MNRLGCCEWGPQLGGGGLFVRSLYPELWQTAANKRVRPTRAESGDELGYF